MLSVGDAIRTGMRSKFLLTVCLLPLLGCGDSTDADLFGGFDMGTGQQVAAQRDKLRENARHVYDQGVQLALRVQFESPWVARMVVERDKIRSPVVGG